MWRRQLAFQALALLLVLAGCALRERPSVVAGCPGVTGATLGDCLDHLVGGATLELPPGRYVITQPLKIRRAVRITTAGMPDCSAGGCAVLALRLAQPGAATERAITISGAGAVLDHLVVEGGLADPARDDRHACSGRGRASMGGLGITAPDVAVRDSIVTAVACYTAVMADTGASGLVFERNQVIGNGRHSPAPMWADGLTVIDGRDDVIRDNLFRDNTDVQLVLGGCRDCRVTGNRIETTGAPDAGAYAGLLVHAWPMTSGDYRGTTIAGNTVDCGPAHACGFGIGVGGRAWYASPTSGGRITGNHVLRAAVGINVDGIDGPVAMDGNSVTQSGGTVRSRCGTWTVGAVNIAAPVRRFVDPTAGTAVPPEQVTDRSFAGCLPDLAAAGVAPEPPER